MRKAKFYSRWGVGFLCLLLTLSVKAQFADLTIQNASTQQSNYDPGDVVYFSAQVLNAGTIPSLATTVQFYLESTLPPYNFLGFDSTQINAIAPNNWVPASGSIPLPTSIAPGTYYLAFTANNPTAFPEAILSNNHGYATFTVNPQPDLYPTNVSVASSAPQGATVSISTDVRNQGTVAANVNTVLTYWLSSDQNFDPLVDQFVGSDVVPPVGAGGSVTVQGDFSIPSWYPCGNQEFLLVRADGNDQFNEQVESNNVTSYFFTVNCPLPDYTITSSSVNDPVTHPGNVLIAYATILNQGAPTSTGSTLNYWLSEDSILQTSIDILVATDNVFGLGSSVNAQESAWFTLPSNLSCGTWYILFEADGNNQVSESDENNNFGFTEFQVIGNINPVILNLPSSECDNSTSLAIQATPSGGSFSGNGVSGNVFSPSQAGLGQHAIQYIHTISSTGCSDTTSQNITVNAHSSFSQTVNLTSGQSFTLPDGSIVNSAGVYLDTIPAVNGCDSIVTTNLSYQPQNCSYEVPDLTVSCVDLLNDDTICIPIIATSPVPPGVYGLDFSMGYDPQFLQPTNSASTGPVSNSADILTFADTNTHQVHGIIYFSILDSLFGVGEVACVEFQVLPGAMGASNIPLTVSTLIQGGNDTMCVDPGSLNITSDSVLHAQVLFWGDTNKPLPFDSSASNANLPTEIWGTDIAGNITGPTIRPDLNGQFSHHIGNGKFIKLNRDLPNSPCTPPLPAVNSFDALHIFWIALFNGPAFTPNVYQMIAADVDANSQVNSQDISFLQRRITGQICEFPQTSFAPSLDWRFIDDDLMANNSAYTISSNYPFPDGIGYSKGMVPNPPTHLPIQESSSFGCNQVDSTTYHAILVGDVSGSWTTGMAPFLKSTSGDSIHIPLDQAVLAPDSCTILVPVFLPGTDTLWSLDLNMDFDSSKVEILDVLPASSPGDHFLSDNTLNGQQLLVSDLSISPNGISLNGNLALYIKVKLEQGLLQASDFSNLSGFVGPNPASVAVSGGHSCSTEVSIDLMEQSFRLYPNPFKDEFHVEFLDSESWMGIDATIFDMAGKKVWSQRGINEQAFTLQPKLPGGVYNLNLRSGAYSRNFKIIQLD